MSVPVSGIFWRKETCQASSIGVCFFPMLTFSGWSLIKQEAMLLSWQIIAVFNP